MCIWLVDLFRLLWCPHPGSGTTMTSPRQWSQKFARQPSVTASTFQNIPPRHHPHAGKTTRHHPQKAWKPMRHHLQNTGTQTRHHPQNTVTQMRHHPQDTGKRTWHHSQNTGEPTMQMVEQNFKEHTLHKPDNSRKEKPPDCKALFTE